jgi:UDP-N-acetylglucosamine 1-carboxyvinyltransferase
MRTETTKIASFISQLRLQRGLTQKELANLLGTSQSAVNRIESGRQNLSMEMLAKISQALNKEIITLSRGDMSFAIEGGRKLSGSVTTKVSKNATVGLLCASLLNQGSTTLKHAPRIEEVYRIIEVLKSIGVSVRWEGENLTIQPPKHLRLNTIDKEAAMRTRSIIMFLGPLIHSQNEFTLPPPGGCKLGSRTIRPHLFALENFGVKVKATPEGWHVKVGQSIKNNRIVMYESGNTPTENAIMAAAKVNGITTINRAASNYMVQDLCLFLQKLGVKIDGIGTHTLTIHGKPVINTDVEYYPSEDPIEAVTFLSIAATTNSAITIKRAPIDFIELELLKLQKMGCRYTLSQVYKANNGVTNLADINCLQHSGLVALEDKIEAHDDPGMNIDSLPYFAPIAATAKGKTLIHDWTYENRAIYYVELNKLNASVSLLDVHRVLVTGPTEWKPADLVCPPALRPAVIILIAMLAAPGTSILRNVYSINRGYEDLANRLNELGAKISVIRDL